MPNQAGRKHELSAWLCWVGDVSQLISPADEEKLKKLARLLADHDVATIEELKERLK